MVIKIELKKALINSKAFTLKKKKATSKKQIEGNFLEPCQYYINDLLGKYTAYKLCN